MGGLMNSQIVSQWSLEQRTQYWFNLHLNANTFFNFEVIIGKQQIYLHTNLHLHPVIKEYSHVCTV